MVIHNIKLPPGEFWWRSRAYLLSRALDLQPASYFADICRVKVSAHFLSNVTGALTSLLFLPQARVARRALRVRWPPGVQ